MHLTSTDSTSGGSTAFVIGSNLFANYQPHSTRATVCLYETPGGPPQYHFGSTNVASWENQRLKVSARSSAPPSGATVADPTNAKILARRALTRLQDISNQTVQGSTYLRVQATSSIYLSRVEDDGRQVYDCDYDVMRRPSTTGLN